MKVSEGQGSPDSARPTQSGAPAQPKRKSFDRVLEEKSGSKSQSRAAGLKPADDPTAALSALLMRPGLPIADVDAKPAAGGAESVNLQQLVHEIVAVTGPDGRHSVDIQFDSRVLDGLQVRVAGDHNGVSIRFTAASDQVASLLTPNIDALAQALEAKGVRVAGIDVQTAAKRESNSRRDSQRQGGGRNRS